MKTFLNIIRWFITIILTIVTTVLLLLSPILFSLNMVFSTREKPKEILFESRIYEEIPELIDIPEMPVNIDIITPDLVQQLTEEAIDSLYDLLEGKTDILANPLESDLLKNTFIDKLIQTTGFEKEFGNFSELPTCTQNDIDLFSTGEVSQICIPDSTDISTIFNSFIPSEDQAIPDELIINPLTKPLEEKILETIRLGYRVLVNVTTYILISLFILIPLTILIAPNHKGVTKILISLSLLISIPGLIVWGLYTMLNTAAISYLADILSSTLDNTIPVSIVLNVTNILLINLFKYAGYIQIVIGIIAILMLITFKLLSKQEKTEEVIKKLENRSEK